MTSRTARPRSMLLRNGLSERSGIPGMRSVGDELAVIRGDNRVNSMVQERFESTGFRSDFFTVAMVRVGTIVGRLDHQSFQLNSGDIALSPPQRIKHLVGIEKDTEIWVICFTVDFLRRLKLRGLSEHMSIFAAANLPVIFGLIFATFLTLILVPVMLLIVQKIKHRKQWKRQMREAATAQAQ